MHITGNHSLYSVMRRAKPESKAEIIELLPNFCFAIVCEQRFREHVCMADLAVLSTTAAGCISQMQAVNGFLEDVFETAVMQYNRPVKSSLKIELPAPWEDQSWFRLEDEQVIWMLITVPKTEIEEFVRKIAADRSERHAAAEQEAWRRAGDAREAEVLGHGL